MSVNTAKAPRRPLNFTCLGCVTKDLDGIQAAHHAGTLRTTGNWNPGEIMDHCAILYEAGLDGSKQRIPWLGRLMGRLFKKSLLKPGGMKPGFKLPKDAVEMMPRPGVTFDEGMKRMRRALQRLERGEQMTKPSPFLGPLTHDEWLRLNLNHTQMHFSFMAY
ncbi:MAG: DUF1569 domain-containing protein [Phycisphaerales bacterium]